MSSPSESVAANAPTGLRAGLPERFARFVADRHPFALRPALEAFDRTGLPALPAGALPAQIDAQRPALRDALGRALDEAVPAVAGETTPRVAAARRLERAGDEVLEECDGFLIRERVVASLTRAEKLELLRGMLLTRATDNRLKTLFTGSELRFESGSFQGKGFRSLGQEAIYAAPLRLRRGERWRGPDDAWQGDVVAPLIRDLGAALAMHPAAETVRLVLSAQAGKAGPPMDGRDFHLGDMARGILPPTAPLSISSLTVAGLALAFQRRGEERVAVSFIGEGGSSLGEWHEAINLCAARRLPAVFCVQNNQTALSTPVEEQSAVRAFADKAAGYGIPGLTLDGNDAEAVAAAFAWAAERARGGSGPALLELVTMRMCGHAHHDDMLYLGRDPQPGWDYPERLDTGYADPEAWSYWAARDPIARYARTLESEGLLEPGGLEELRTEVHDLVEAEAQAVIAAPWPEPESVGRGVVAGEEPRTRVDPLARDEEPVLELPPLEPFEPDPKGRTFLEAITLGLGDALRADARCFVFGEDVGGRYGNAFLLLRPLLEEHGDRILNAPIAEGAILGACTGAAVAGLRPIAEMQFNDFVATGFNQLVNNAAKLRYRTGLAVPMVVRMPWGGLRNAGPYHSQNTEPWFYRTPGLKIVAPATPADARALLAAAVADPDPVLFYEHIGLYRDPRVKQALADLPPEPLPLGRAALRREGRDLAIVSYGAYVHVALRVAGRLAGDGVEASVLDLRSLAPLDRRALLAVARQAGKVLIVHEDTRTGSLGESLAAIVQEEAFEHLDAPVRVLGALDTPVPYSPPLEAAFLPGEDVVLAAARALAAW